MRTRAERLDAYRRLEKILGDCETAAKAIENGRGDVVEDVPKLSKRLIDAAAVARVGAADEGLFASIHSLSSERVLARSLREIQAVGVRNAEDLVSDEISILRQSAQNSLGFYESPAGGGEVTGEVIRGGGDA